MQVSIQPLRVSMRAAYLYAVTDKDGQDGHRVLYASGRGCAVRTAMEDFQDTVDQYNRGDLRREGAALVISASKDELDPEHPLHQWQMQRIAEEISRRAFAGRQNVTITQADGSTGQLHTHVLVPNVAHEDAEIRFQRRAKEVTRNGRTVSVPGEDVVHRIKAGDAMHADDTNAFRLRHVCHEVLADEQFMASIDFDNQRLAQRMQERAEFMGRPGYRPSGAQHAYDNEEVMRVCRDKGEWLEDLKTRVRDARDHSTSAEEFEEHLTADGVVQMGHPDKGRQWSFRHTDELGTVRTARGGGKRLHSTEFSRKALLVALQENAQQARVAAQQPVAAPAPPVQRPTPDLDDAASVEEFMQQISRDIDADFGEMLDARARRVTEDFERRWQREDAEQAVHEDPEQTVPATEQPAVAQRPDPPTSSRRRVEAWDAQPTQDAQAVPAPEPAWRSALRDVALADHSGKVRQRLEGAAALEERWHERMPSTPEERREFEERVRAAGGLGRQFLDSHGDRMDAAVRDRLEQRVEAARTTKDLFESGTAAEGTERAETQRRTRQARDLIRRGDYAEATRVASTRPEDTRRAEADALMDRLGRATSQPRKTTPARQRMRDEVARERRENRRISERDAAESQDIEFGG